MTLSKNYYDDPQTDEDFIQIAIDVYGNAIRDNNRKDKIALGKEYHNPPTCPECGSDDCQEAWGNKLCNNCNHKWDFDNEAI